MFNDAKLWQAIRHRYLKEGASKRQLMRETGLGWSTLKKVLANPLPLRYSRRNCQQEKLAKFRDLRSDDEKWQDILTSLESATVHDCRQIVAAIGSVKANYITKSRLTLLRKRLCDHLLIPANSVDAPLRSANAEWLYQVMQGKKTADQISEELSHPKDIELLVEKARNGRLRQRNRALAVLGRLKCISARTIASSLHISANSACRYWKRYEVDGVEGLFATYQQRGPLLHERKDVQEAVFEVLHSPPSDYNINRTSWRMDDLLSVLAASGHPACKDVVRRVIQSSGFRWRKARVVLTSPDPAYREKLQHIQSILSSLPEEDRFFSIDEFGPFSIKMKGGKRLAAPDEFPFVPQIQKSKGFLIVTGALELSRNQVTHFYSWKKNTVEMLRLLHLLLETHRGCRKLYFSWDAASWHASKRLFREVEKVNSLEYRELHGTPLVELAPLPASAQFLNVIESVFSGMAKAIIHNSDYASASEAMAAIDRYFAERNEQFRKNPRRAGRKIWGQERVPPVFGATHNCKDPRFCG